MKKYIIVIVVILVVLGGWYFFKSQDLAQNIEDGNNGPLNATYLVDNQPYTLKDGLLEEMVPNSVSKIITRYFGNEIYTDLNNDGREDIVFILTQEAGGSGTFFYVVAALNMDNGWQGSHALLLGDRIAPQTTELSQNPSHKNVIVVNYADRKPNEPMSVQPSVGKSIWLKLNPETMQFGEVVQDFEGEANPEVMSLDMKTWQWIRTTYNNDTQLVPTKAGAFTVTFNDDGSFSATTDCNSMSGTYSVADNILTFGEDIAMTRMFCEGSQELVFSEMLREIRSFFFTSRGELVLELKFDTGSVIFR